MRQINVKYPCVSTYEKHETWVPYHSCCSLYLLSKTTKCHETEEIPFPPLILSFFLDLLEFFEGSRDKAGLQTAVCEIQATQIAKVKEPWCVCCWFWRKKPGPLSSLWVTCSMFQHPTGKIAWAAKVGNTPESQAYLWAAKSNRARQQLEAEELLEEIASAWSHPSHSRKTIVFWKTSGCSKS